MRQGMKRSKGKHLENAVACAVAVAGGQIAPPINGNAIFHGADIFQGR